MKNISIVAFTPRGGQLGLKLKHKMEEQGYACALYASGSAARESKLPSIGSLSHWTERAFKTSEALIFIGACGIAVRAIAPFVKDKFSDPAVLSIDESGQFVVPLLSGHMGGANDLAILIAELIYAQAVITTATDVNGLFSVDVWAKKNNLFIDGRDAAKHISAAIIRGEAVSFKSDFPDEGALPDGVIRGESRIGFYVTLSKKKPFDDTLLLHPRIITLGIGCRRGISFGKIDEAVTGTLLYANIPIQAVSGVATIDLKSDEEGLLQYCKEKDFTLTTYTAEELKKVDGYFTRSAFVENVTGIDNVCERAACIKGGKLIIRKQICDGVTVAAAISEYTVKF